MLEYTKKNWDLIIIGAGPCGLSAGLVAAQNGLKAIIIDKASSCGGQIERWIDCPIKDIPGQPQIEASDLIQGLLKQIKSAGVTVCNGQSVKEVRATSTGVAVQLDDQQIFYSSRVLICTGAVPRKLEVSGEDAIAWGTPYSGVSRAGSLAVVVGGGDEACSSSLALAKSQSKVILLVRNEIKARNNFADAVARNPFIEVWRGEEVSGIEKTPSQILLKLASQKEIIADEVFIRIGMKIVIPQLIPQPKLLEDGRLSVNNEWRTTVPMIYAGGDAIRPPSQSYIIIAMADGVGSARAIVNDLVGLSHLVQ